MDKIKYIVIGSYRSGTTVVNESLEKHSKLKVAYEIFHNSPKERGFKDGEKILNDLYNTTNFDFIESVYPRYASKGYWYETQHIGNEMNLDKYVDYIFSKYNGFKILYDQLSLENNLWNYLLENNIKFIHVIRQNFLDIYISLYAAQITKNWQTLTGEKPKSIKPFFVDPVGLENFFKMMYFLNDHFSSLLKNQNLLTINYSDIKSWQKTMALVQEFLNIPYEEVHAKYQKTIHQNKKNLIINYDELIKYFKNTKSSLFFNLKEFI